MDVRVGAGGSVVVYDCGCPNHQGATIWDEHDKKEQDAMRVELLAKLRALKGGHRAVSADGTQGPAFTPASDIAAAIAHIQGGKP